MCTHDKPMPVGGFDWCGRCGALGRQGDWMNCIDSLARPSPFVDSPDGVVIPRPLFEQQRRLGAMLAALAFTGGVMIGGLLVRLAALD